MKYLFKIAKSTRDRTNDASLLLLDSAIESQIYAMLLIIIRDLLIISTCDSVVDGILLWKTQFLDNFYYLL